MNNFMSFQESFKNHFIYRGHAGNLSIGHLFIGLLDTVTKSSLLMPSLSKSRHSNYSFINYLKDVQPKLGIQIDLTSKNALRTLKVGYLVKFIFIYFHL